MFIFGRLHILKGFQFGRVGKIKYIHESLNGNEISVNPINSRTKSQTFFYLAAQIGSLLEGGYNICRKLPQVITNSFFKVIILFDMHAYFAIACYLKFLSLVITKFHSLPFEIERL